MHSRSITTLAIFLVSYVGFCQGDAIKMNIGMSRTNVILKPTDVFNIYDEFKTGFNAEIIYKHKISRPFYIGGGIGYIQNGYKFNMQLIGGNQESLGFSKQTWNFNYMNFPLHVGIELGDEIYFLGDFALVPAVLLTSEIVSEQSNTRVGGDVTEEIGTLDLSGRIGVGVGKYLNDLLALDLNLAYQQSITETEFGNVVASGDEDNDFSHLGLLLRLGLTYQLR